MRTLLLAWAVFGLCSPSWADITGNAWRDAPENFKDGYLMGVYGAWMEDSNVAKSYRARHADPKEEPASATPPLGHFGECIIEKELPYRQLRAIVEKYLDENPIKWDSPMSRIAWMALLPRCMH